MDIPVEQLSSYNIPIRDLDHFKDYFFGKDKVPEEGQKLEFEDVDDDGVISLEASDNPYEDDVKESAKVVNSKEETKEMTQALDLQTLMLPRGDSGVGAAGLGGGLIGGVLLGALLGRNGGLFGGNDGAAVASSIVTKEDLALQSLGDIKASIPFNEAQVQLALSQAVASLTAQNNSNTQYLSSQNTAAALAAATNAALIARDIASVDTNVDRQSTAIQIAIRDDGEKTRALITANTITDLQQRLTVAQLENAENRAINREQVNSHNVTTTITNNQQQQQLQAQRQDFLLNGLVAGFGQIAQATNSNVIVGSTGVGTTQTANPTNVRA